MSKIHDGGPAFPTHDVQYQGDHWSTYPGMSLRDHFAGLAMHALMRDTPRTVMIARETGVSPSEALANMAYEAADAMLTERAKVLA